MTDLTKRGQIFIRPLGEEEMYFFWSKKLRKKTEKQFPIAAMHKDYLIKFLGSFRSFCRTD